LLFKNTAPDVVFNDIHHKRREMQPESWNAIVIPIHIVNKPSSNTTFVPDRRPKTEDRGKKTEGGSRRVGEWESG